MAEHISAGRHRDTVRRHGSIGSLLAAGGLVVAVTLGMALTMTTNASAPFAAAASTTFPRDSNSPSPTEACWVIVPSPSQASVLYGVAAVSANDVWAVGTYGLAVVARPLVAHWNGTEWSAVPNPYMDGRGTLYGVAAVSTNDVWAVGEYLGTGTNTLVERWDGTAWTVVPSPNPGLGGSLLGVAAVSANDVWAVGSYYDEGTSTRKTLVEHWDGTAWSVVPSPNPNPASPMNYLQGVAAVSTNDVWAVGLYGDGSTDQTLVEHWDGTAWTIVPSPSPGTRDNWLLGLAAVSANDVWAVGVMFGDTTTQTLVERWDGTAWSVVPSPSPGNEGTNFLYSVAAVSANDVWAVGMTCTQSACAGSADTLVEHWDGSAWSVVPSASRNGGENLLRGVAAVATNDVWAVGETYSASPPPGTEQALVEHPGPCAPPTATPTPTSTPRCPGEVFSDVCPLDYFYPPVMYLYNHGAISGYADGTFRPYNYTTRGQLTKIIVLAEGWPIATPSGTPTFADVPADDPFFSYVETAVGHGIISGYADGTFHPTNNVTRGQLCRIAVLAQGWPLYTPPSTPTFSDVPRDHPFFAYVETAYSHGAISGYFCGSGCLEFRPGNSAMRGQIAKIVYNARTYPERPTRKGLPPANR